MDLVEIDVDESAPDTPRPSINSQDREDLQMALEESPIDIGSPMMPQPVVEAPKPRLQDNAFFNRKHMDNPARSGPRTKPTVKLFKDFITKEQQTALLEAASRLRNNGQAWEIHGKRANTRPECIEKKRKVGAPDFRSDNRGRIEAGAAGDH